MECSVRQESWSQADNGHTQADNGHTQADNGHTQAVKKAGKSKLGLKDITGSHKRARKRLSRVKTNNISHRYKQNELN
jgi:hypothetical protein